MKANMILKDLLSVFSKTIYMTVGMLFFLSNQLKAQNSEMAARLTRYEVKPEYREIFSQAVRNYILNSLEQESNILSEAYYEEEKPSVLWIIERWRTKGELKKINESAAFTVLGSLSERALVKPLKVIDVNDLEPLTKQQWREVADKDNKPITIMLFVDAKTGTENHFKKVYHTAMPHFRSEPGVITYQLSQLEEDSSQFVTYEKFRNEAAFQYHLKFSPIQPVIDYLENSIKKQPFQTGLHRLVEFAPLSRD